MLNMDSSTCFQGDPESPSAQMLGTESASRIENVMKHSYTLPRIAVSALVHMNY